MRSTSPSSADPWITFKNIARFTKLVPHVITESYVSQVKDEWRFYMVEFEGSLKKANGCKRVNKYWSAVFAIKTTSGSLNYTTLQRVLKVFLSFANGNAAVEKSLSDNKNTVTCERSKLMEETIVGQRLLKEYVHKQGGAHSVPISEEMIDGMKKLSV